MSGEISTINNLLSNLSDEQLIVVARRVQDEREFRAAKKKNSFRVGDRVSFTSSRQHRLVVGTITKICPKNIKLTEVDKPNSRWTVHPSFLKKV